MSRVRSAIASHAKWSSTRRRAARPISAARSGSATTAASASPRSATNSSGRTGVPVPSCTCSIGTRTPVTPSSTTSGIPPVAVPTTGSPHAIASRLTIPSGSYTDGHTNTVPAESTATRSCRGGVVWIEQMLPRQDLVAVLSAGTVFVCPSVYEPLGIVNLEAMACGLPVVGTATGGIPEVVDDGVTGVLVPIEQVQDGTGTPVRPDEFVADLGDALAAVVADPDRAAEMGRAARRRVEDHFAWDAIAEQTLDVYRSVL